MAESAFVEVDDGASGSTLEGTSFSLLGRATLGVKTTHQKLRLGAEPATSGVSTPDGRLILSSALPLLGGRYRYVRSVGEGAFSQILVCDDTYAVDAENQAREGCPPMVAIKVMNLKYTDIGAQELVMLRFLNQMDCNDCARLVRTISAFDFHGHFCIVMVRLGKSLLHWRRQQHLRLARLPASLGDARTLMIRPLRKLAIQLLSSLLFLHRRGVIHADMKPENILSDVAHAVDRDGLSREEDEDDDHSEHDAMAHSGRFRLVDFGNAMLLKNASLYHDDFEVQSLCYRAPEVLLGLDFGCPIDMWSFGCIMAEMLTGKTLFEGKNRRELLSKMFSLIGPLPKTRFAQAKFFPVFNDEDPRHFSTADPNVADGHNKPSLSDIRHNQLRDHLQVKDAHLIDFIDRCLEYDPDLRMTPAQALRHPFIAPLFPFADLMAPTADGLETTDDEAHGRSSPIAGSASAVLRSPVKVEVSPRREGRHVRASQPTAASSEPASNASQHNKNRSSKVVKRNRSSERSHHHASGGDDQQQQETTAAQKRLSVSKSVSNTAAKRRRRSSMIPEPPIAGFATERQRRKQEEQEDVQRESTERAKSSQEQRQERPTRNATGQEEMTAQTSSNAHSAATSKAEPTAKKNKRRRGMIPEPPIAGFAKKDSSDGDRAAADTDVGDSRSSRRSSTSSSARAAAAAAAAEEEEEIAAARTMTLQHQEAESARQEAARQEAERQETARAAEVQAQAQAAQAQAEAMAQAQALAQAQARARAEAKARAAAAQAQARAQATAAAAAEQAEKEVAWKQANEAAARRKQADADAKAAAAIAAAVEAPTRQRRAVRAPIQFWTAQGVTEGAARTKTSVKSVRQQAPGIAAAADISEQRIDKSAFASTARGRAEVREQSMMSDDFVEDSEDDEDDGHSVEDDEEQIWGSGRKAKSQKRGHRRHQLE